MDTDREIFGNSPAHYERGCSDALQGVVCHGEPNPLQACSRGKAEKMPQGRALGIRFEPVTEEAFAVRGVVDCSITQ